MFKKADIFLLLILLVVGMLATYLVSSADDLGTHVKISIAGEVYGTYSLGEDRTITISKHENYNEIVIKNGKVFMSDADCPNKVCVKHSPIDSTGESIVCLPNKVLIEIVGGEKYDAVSS
ncbi:MAG: NusG domain II-containing protein [Clostridiales bacterium]|jgi:hypothetical protein|nr:NusG domain II-containing protein [Clostridiales bacterium]